MQRRPLNTIPQRVHYGSRTHKNVKEGKNIRVDADGFENFSDYFSSPAVSECSQVSAASSRRTSVRLLTRRLVNGPGSAKSLQESYHEHIDSMSSFTPQSAASDLNSFSQEKNSAQLSEERESSLYPQPDVLMHGNSVKGTTVKATGDQPSTTALPPGVSCPPEEATLGTNGLQPATVSNAVDDRSTADLVHTVEQSPVASADATAGAARYPGLNLNGDRRGTICAPIVQTADAKQISPGLAIQTRKRLSYAVDSGSGSEQSKSSAIKTSQTVSGAKRKNDSQIKQKAVVPPVNSQLLSPVTISSLNSKFSRSLPNVELSEEPDIVVNQHHSVASRSTVVKSMSAELVSDSASGTNRMTSDILFSNSMVPVVSSLHRTSTTTDKEVLCAPCITSGGNDALINVATSSRQTLSAVSNDMSKNSVSCMTSSGNKSLVKTATERLSVSQQAFITVQSSVSDTSEAFATSFRNKSGIKTATISQPVSAVIENSLSTTSTHFELDVYPAAVSQSISNIDITSLSKNSSTNTTSQPLSASMNVFETISVLSGTSFKVSETTTTGSVMSQTLPNSTALITAISNIGSATASRNGATLNISRSVCSKNSATTNTSKSVSMTTKIVSQDKDAVMAETLITSNVPTMVGTKVITTIPSSTSTSSLTGVTGARSSALSSVTSVVSPVMESHPDVVQTVPIPQKQQSTVTEKLVTVPSVSSSSSISQVLVPSRILSYGTSTHSRTVGNDTVPSASSRSSTTDMHLRHSTNQSRRVLTFDEDEDDGNFISLGNKWKKMLVPEAVEDDFEIVDTCPSRLTSNGVSKRDHTKSSVEATKETVNIVTSGISATGTKSSGHKPSSDEVTESSSSDTAAVSDPLATGHSKAINSISPSLCVIVAEPSGTKKQGKSSQSNVRKQQDVAAVIPEISDVDLHKNISAIIDVLDHTLAAEDKEDGKCFMPDSVDIAIQATGKLAVQNSNADGHFGSKHELSLSKSERGDKKPEDKKKKNAQRKETATGHIDANDKHDSERKETATEQSAQPTCNAVNTNNDDDLIVGEIVKVSKKIVTSMHTKVTTASKVKRNARVNYDEDLEDDTDQEDESHKNDNCATGNVVSKRTGNDLYSGHPSRAVPPADSAVSASQHKKVSVPSSKKKTGPKTSNDLQKRLEHENTDSTEHNIKLTGMKNQKKDSSPVESAAVTTDDCPITLNQPMRTRSCTTKKTEIKSKSIPVYKNKKTQKSHCDIAPQEKTLMSNSGKIGSSTCSSKDNELQTQQDHVLTNTQYDNDLENISAIVPEGAVERRRALHSTGHSNMFRAASTPLPSLSKVVQLTSGRKRRPTSTSPRTKQGMASKHRTMVDSALQLMDGASEQVEAVIVEHRVEDLPLHEDPVILSKRQRKSVTYAQPESPEMEYPEEAVSSDSKKVKRKKANNTENSETTTPLPRYSTASPLHYFDTTHANNGTIKKKANKPSQENRIIPPSNTPGVRRSCRTRVRPLDWFRNERIKYDQHKPLWTVIGIESPPQPETKPKVGKVEKLVRKIIRKDKKLAEEEAKRKKNKLRLRRESSFHIHRKPLGSAGSTENPNISFCSQPAFLPSHPAPNTLPSSPAPVFLASHPTSDTVPSSPAHSIASNSASSKQGRAKTGIVVINPLTDKEEIIDCVKSKSNYQLFGSSGKEATADDPFILCKPIRQKNFASGFVTLRGFQQKNPSFVQNDIMAFTVMRGELEVTIHRTKCLVEADDCFFVPPGNTYSIRNLRSEVACLSYTQVKGSHGQPSVIKE